MIDEQRFNKTLEANAAEPDIGVSAPVASWRNPRVPVWLVRVIIAALSGLLGGIGASLVVVYRGGLTYNGTFTWGIAWSTCGAVAIALGVCFSERFRGSAIARWAVGIGLIALTTALTQDGVVTLLISVGGAVALVAVLVPLQIGVRQSWIRVLRPVLRRIPGPFALGMFVLLTLGTQIVSAPPAYAQSDDRQCAEPPVVLTIDGNSIDLTNAVGSNPDPIEYRVDLDANSTFDVVASSVDGRKVVVTLELVRTAPVDVVRGEPRLIWHNEVAGDTAETLTLTRERNGELDYFSATVGENSTSVDLFTGVGTFRVTLTDRTVDGEAATCAAEVNLRVVGSNWGTDIGRWVTFATIVGAAGCGSVALVRPEVVLPAGSCVDATILENGKPVLRDASKQYALKTGTKYDMKLDLQFLDAELDEKELDKLRDGDVMQLSGIRKLVTFKPKFRLSAGSGAVAVTAFEFAHGAVDNTLVVHVGSESFTRQIRLVDRDLPGANADLEVDR